jgi:hypothetical protein
MKQHYHKLNQLNAELQILSEYVRTPDVNRRMTWISREMERLLNIVWIDLMRFNTNSCELEKEGEDVRENEQSFEEINQV